MSTSTTFIYKYFFHIFGDNIITSFPPSLSTLQTLPYNLLCYTNLWLLLLFIVATYIYVYMYTHKCIPKYSLLSLQNFTCMYAFMADHLVWLSDWCVLPQARLFCPLSAFLSCLWSFVYVWLRFHKISPHP